MKQNYITLNDGNKIPQFGLGVYMIRGDEETEKACLKALEIGYRHIDTAHAYQNERGVGSAVKKSGIPREDIWITSKLWPSEYGEGKTMKAISKMLDRLDTPYIDLLLLHQQFGDYVGAWKDMERAVALGFVKSIGISNFNENLDDFLLHAENKPSIIQVECHPYFAQHDLKKKLAPYGTVVESWYPLGHGDPSLLNEPIFVELGKKYRKTPVQIILRWHVQEGNIVFPKSTNPQHLKDNIDIFDFELTDEEMAKIAKLDCGKRYFTLNLKEQEAHLSAFTPAD